jgi:hypothetical protein
MIWSVVTMHTDIWYITWIERSSRSGKVFSRMIQIMLFS